MPRYLDHLRRIDCDMIQRRVVMYILEEICGVVRYILYCLLMVMVLLLYILDVVDHWLRCFLDHSSMSQIPVFVQRAFHATHKGHGSCVLFGANPKELQFIFQFLPSSSSTNCFIGV